MKKIIKIVIRAPKVVWQNLKTRNVYKTGLLPPTNYSLVQIRDEGGNLGIIKVPKGRKEWIISKIPFFCRKYLEPSLLVLGLVLAWSVIVGTLVFYVAMTLDMDSTAAKVIFLTPPFGWMFAGGILAIAVNVMAYTLLFLSKIFLPPYRYIVTINRLGNLPSKIFKRFVAKFAHQKVLGGWIIPYKSLRIAQQFQQESPNEFKKVIEQAQNLEEFAVLSAIRKS